MNELQEKRIEDKEQEMINIALHDGTVLKLEHGRPISELVSKIPEKDSLPYICAKVQNDIHSLDFIPEMDCQIELLNYRSAHGRECYRRSLTFVLARAVMELYRNARLTIDHSIGNGFYYDLFTDVPVSEKILGYIKTKMLEIINKDEPFGKKTLTRPEAIALLNREGYPEKARLLKNLNTDKVSIVSCWKYVDLDLGPMVPSTGYLKVFDLKQYAQGFVLLFPDNDEPSIPSEVRRQPKIFQAYRESKSWGKILEVNNVGRLNEIIKDKSVSDFI
jgi:uridine kinase